MPDLTFQDALNILRLIDSGPFPDLEIEFEGTMVKVTRQAASAVARPAESLRASAAAGHGLAAKPEDQLTAMSHTPALPPVVESQHKIEVKPPMAGTFYTSPAPGAPPYAAANATVKKGDTLGIVEVMKLFTSVLSPCDGTVRAILVANEEFVQSDQTLMIIDAAGH